MAGSDDDDQALRAADELLAQEEGQSSSKQHHRRASSITSTASHVPLLPSNTLPIAPPTASRDLIASLTVLVVISTVSTHQLPAVAQHSKSALLAFPALHYASLALLGVALGYLRPLGVFGSSRNGEGGLGASFAGKGGERANRKIMAIAGVCSAVSLIMRLWTTRRNQSRLVEAVDVFVLPTILLAIPYLSPRLPFGSPLHAPTSSTFATTVCLSTFMAGFALIGIYGSSAKLFLAVLRLPFEASSILLLKEGLSDEGKSGEFLLGTAAVATVTSLATVPFGIFLMLEPFLHPTSFLSLAFALLSSIATQVAFLIALYLFSSPLTATGTLFARNFLLLLLSAIGREHLPIRDNWLQVIFVYAAGTAAVAWADPEVSSAVRGISSQQSTATGYNLLPINGANGSISLSNPPSPSPSKPNSPPALGNRKPSNERVTTTSNSTSSTHPGSTFLLALLPFIPLLIHLLQDPASSMTPLSTACSLLPPSLRSAICPATALPYDTDNRSVDLVISYYDEDFNRVKEHIGNMRSLPFVRDRMERVVVYNKGSHSEEELRKGFDLYETDDVVPIENVGREGETYLKHIMLHYNDTIDSSHLDINLPTSLVEAQKHLQRTTLASHTFFLQPHLAWPWVAQNRLNLVEADTGFAHLGPLIPSTCGKDDKVAVDFPLWVQVFSIFTGQMCPPGGQTMAWSGQFVVSRKRILANDYSRYSYVDDILSAPKDHWIHNQWGPNESGGPSNPVFGHAIERAWPAIFNCWDPKLAKECEDNIFVKEKCTCLDVI